MGALTEQVVAVGILLAASFVLLPSTVTAGSQPQVDLSLQVTSAPVSFTPGGHVDITLTVHNAGPDTAGATNPGQTTLYVVQDQYIYEDNLPPFEMDYESGDCIIELFDMEPLPGGEIPIVWLFHFGPIPAGESASCSYGIGIHSSTHHNFTSHWYVTSFDEVDTNPDNNTATCTFLTSAVSLPSLTWWGFLTLGAALIAAAGTMARLVYDET
jgi:hypothetical protein